MAIIKDILGSTNEEMVILAKYMKWRFIHIKEVAPKKSACARYTEKYPHWPYRSTIMSIHLLLKLLF